MAISKIYTSWLLCLTILVLSAVLPESADAHIAMLKPRPRGGFGTVNFDWRIHEFVGYQGYKYPCGGYKYDKRDPITEMRAGELINVRFFTTDMKDLKDVFNKLPPKNIKQARHGGGQCEFSLSTDGGSSFHVIGKYTKTCPDVIYEWPVRIPDNVPNCDEPGKCLFAWSWAANLMDQFYHNCADIKLIGTSNGKLPEKTIELYDFGNHPYKALEGDGKSQSAGAGPKEDEKRENSRKKSLY